MRFCLLFLIVSFLVGMPVMAQDATPTAADAKAFNPADILDFGEIVLSFDIPMDNRDFLLGKLIAVQPDLSRIYVASGVSGIVYIFDDKGRLLDEVDTFYEYPATDMIVGADGNLYVVQATSVFIYDRDGQRIRELPSTSLDDTIFLRVAPLDDKTMYTADFFNDKGQLFHLDSEGVVIWESERGFFDLISGDVISIFDQITLGQDGFLYYFSDEAKTMYQINDDWEVSVQYSGLITEQNDPQRTGVLVDAQGKVLLGYYGGVQVFGEKEQIVAEIKLAEQFAFVHHMAFADNGLLAVVQPNTVSVIQYGLRDDD